MKKIQVSTVRQTADVEVLFVNANLISKVINANNAVSTLIKTAKAMGEIIPRFETVLNDEGEPLTDEKGIITTNPVLDEKGNQIIDYSWHKLTVEELASINTKVAPLLQELVDAFMGE